jgi:hypothetical protein
MVEGDRSRLYRGPKKMSKMALDHCYVHAGDGCRAGADGRKLKSRS